MELVPLLPLMMRTNRTDLVVMEVLVRNVIFREVLVREVLEGELLLLLLGLEAIAPAWPGSEAAKTPPPHKNIKHRVMKPMDPQNSMNVVL